MDINSAMMQPLIEKVILDGQEVSVEFPVLKNADLAKLAEHIKSQHKSNCKKNLDEAKVSGIDRYKALSNLDLMFVTTGEVMDYCSTFEGSLKAVSLSLKKAGKTDEEVLKIADAYDPIDFINLALNLGRFVSRKRVDMTKSEDAEKN